MLYLEQSKKKIQVEATWHEGIFLGIKDESEVAVVGTPHGIVFARSIRRVPKEDSVESMLFNSLPWDLQPWMTDETLTTVLLLSHERGHTGQSRVTECTCTAGHHTVPGKEIRKSQESYTVPVYVLSVNTLLVHVHDSH